MYEGDVDLSGDIDFGDIADGDVELSLGDVEAIGAGAPLAARVLSKRLKKRGADDDSARANTIASSVAYSASAGKLIDSVSLPAIIPKNAVIKQEATSTKLPGSLVATNVRRMLILSCYQSLLKTVPAVPGANYVDIVLDKTLFAQAGADSVDLYTVPVLFLTISASVLNAVSGGLYSIQFIEGSGEGGVSIDKSIWQFERFDATKSIMLTIIPYTRVKDVIKPVTGLISNSNYLASDHKLVLRLTGLAEKEQVQVTVPGVDSNDLRAFQRSYGIKG